MADQPLILITDDEKSIRNILRDILEFEKYGVTEAENGEEALAVIKKKTGRPGCSRYQDERDGWD